MSGLLEGISCWEAVGSKRGTAIVRVAENGPDLARTLGRISGTAGAEVVPVDNSYVREGTSLGSGRARALREPRVLLVYGEPGSSLSVG